MGKRAHRRLLMSALLILSCEGLTPVHFFSHGSTMMLGEQSESADYWKACGDDALAHGLKGVVMMVSSPSIELPFVKSDV